MLQEFSQQVEDTARAVVNEIHTALPGEIVSFNPGAGTAVVKPSGKYVTSDGKELAYPSITDVPVVFPFCQSAGIGMAYPVKNKDDCLIVISEVELDAWRSGAESEGSLRFDLTSAMAIPGLLNGGGALVEKACSKDAVVIQAGATELMLSDEGAEIKAGDNEAKVTEFGVEAKVEANEVKITKSQISIKGDVKVDGKVTCKQLIEGG